MKIAYLTDTYGQVSETFVSDLITGLSHVCEDLTVVCNNDLHYNPDSSGIEVTNFLNPSSIGYRVLFRLFAFDPTKANLHRFDVRLKYAQRQLTPVLKRLQCDVAFIDFGTVAVMAHTTLVKCGIPFVVHFHGADISSELNDSAYRDELGKVFSEATYLIAASNHVKRLLILAGAPREKIQVVFYGVDSENLHVLPWSERRQLPPSVIFLGRFTPKKHPVALVEAFALVRHEVPNAQLTLIGDGPEMSRVRQRIELHNLGDCITLYGRLPREKALPIVNRHWIYAQHSVTATSGDQEGFGLSLAEAAAMELPVVSTLHNGIPEQVIHGDTGFLVHEYDYEAMAKYLVMLLQKPELAEQMGRRGRENILNICKKERRVSDIHRLLENARRFGIL